MVLPIFLPIIFLKNSLVEQAEQRDDTGSIVPQLLIFLPPQ